MEGFLMTRPTRRPAAPERKWWWWGIALAPLIWSFETARAADGSIYSERRAPVSLSLSGSHQAIVGVQALHAEGLYPEGCQPFTEQRFRVQGTFGQDWLFIGFANEVSAIYQRPDQPVVAVPDGT